MTISSLPLCVGLLIGHRVVGLRMVLEDGVSHSVDSSENAFKAAAMGAMRTCKWAGGGGMWEKGEGGRGVGTREGSEKKRGGGNEKEGRGRGGEITGGREQGKWWWEEMQEDYREKRRLFKCILLLP